MLCDWIDNRTSAASSGNLFSVVLGYNSARFFDDAEDALST